MAGFFWLVSVDGIREATNALRDKKGKKPQRLRCAASFCALGAATY
jgi:hypothetical protein